MPDVTPQEPVEQAEIIDGPAVEIQHIKFGTVRRWLVVHHEGKVLMLWGPEGEFSMPGAPQDVAAALLRHYESLGGRIDRSMHPRDAAAAEESPAP
ncbi:hypothetical protein [Rathayibacter sp. VKM Ac-2630]|uniref:hypothetical protein n=1 Tax=Rathayibacter sp. VKM Ac-2630 TaxID=1938617 RepID=UPI000981AC6C|nr:hypothetical protein [Rathayibacter sp. VKM Ac-2630]OOB90303.1 hypothetical protein B0T42_12445 [Rathayibacter sp. VKM Ac-2630]